MKTRLLKKLRKEASRRFKLVAVHGGYTAYDAKMNILYVGRDLEAAEALYLSLMNEHIMKKLNILREKRNRRKKVIHYYLW